MSSPRVPLFLLLAILAAVPAAAIDGVIEINQVRALAGGVTPGDAPGFPVTISESGSYRLTGGLEWSDPNSNGISVFASAVTIDLNGFRLRGPNEGGSGSPCTASGSGIAIFGETIYSGITVVNGTVSGAPSVGILLRASSARIANVRVEQSCDDGVLVGPGALITDSNASMNGNAGFVLSDGSRIASSIAVRNRIAGIRNAANGYLIVEDCVASHNGHDGILAGAQSTVRGNQVVDNDVNGIIAGQGASIADNIVVDHPGDSIAVVNGTGAASSNVVSRPSGVGYSGVVHLSCNLDNAGKLCAP